MTETIATKAAKHTHGPWQVVPISPGMFEIRASDISIADIRWNGHNLTRGEANSYLIAAAPELLENLIDAVRFLDAIERKIGREALLDAMPNNCHGRQDMRNAISKAEGH